MCWRCNKRSVGWTCMRTLGVKILNSDRRTDAKTVSDIRPLEITNQARDSTCNGYTFSDRHIFDPFTQRCIHNNNVVYGNVNPIQSLYCTGYQLLASTNSRRVLAVVLLLVLVLGRLSNIQTIILLILCVQQRGTIHTKLIVHNFYTHLSYQILSSANNK